MLRDLRNYILENEFRINYVESRVDVVNYLSVDHFDDDKIMIRYDGGMVVIKGERLVITKLLDEEILISGYIKAIEFR